MKAARVAIIGAGPSGLVAARYAAMCGLQPVVFEKANAIGGVFRGPNASPPGYAWSTMRTNTSVYTTRFSGFTPKPSSHHPFSCQREVTEYLHGYVRHFGLERHLMLEHPVMGLRRLPNGDRPPKWLVTTGGSKLKQDEFDFVILAGGRYAKPHIPVLANASAFKGCVAHSSEYGTLNPAGAFTNKRVVAVGANVSAFELVPQIAQKAASVTHVVKQMPYVVPRWLPTDKAAVVKPWDTVVMSRSRHPAFGHEMRLKSSEIYQLEHLGYSALSSRQCTNPTLDPKRTMPITQPPRVTSGIDYINMIIDRTDGFEKINMEVGDHAEKFTSRGIVLANSKKHIDCDVVLFCTGYKTDMRFLEPDVLNLLEQDSGEDPYLEFILYKLTFRPELQSLAFMGLHDFPLWLYSELQARWISEMFSGKLAFPDKEKVNKYLEEERLLRNSLPQKQISHDDLAGFADSLALEMGILPDFARIKAQEPALYDQLINGTMMYEHFELSDSSADQPAIARARAAINEMSHPAFSSSETR